MADKKTFTRPFSKPVAPAPRAEDAVPTTQTPPVGEDGFSVV